MSDRHRWTPDDDAALHAAVEAVLPLRERLGGRMAFWAAVVGRLGLDLSPDGARSRFERLARVAREAERQRQTIEIVAQAVAEVPDWLRADADGRLRCADCHYVAEAIVDGGHARGCPHEVVDGWDRTARIVEEYERSVGEATLETVTELGARVAQIQRSQSRTERMLVRLCSAWSVDIGPEDER